MEIKKQRIYQCTSQEGARQFLIEAKNAGFVWKNDIEINADTDSASIYASFGDETCFKTNMGKLSFGSKSGYLEKEPTRNIEVWAAKDIPKEIYKTESKADFVRTIIKLQRLGKTVKSHGITLSSSDCGTLYDTSSIRKPYETMYVCLMQDDSIKFVKYATVVHYGWEKFYTPLDLSDVYYPLAYDVAKDIATGEIGIVEGLSSDIVTLRSVGGVMTRLPFERLEKVNVQRSASFCRLTVGDLFMSGNCIFKVTSIFDSILKADFIAGDSSSSAGFRLSYGYAFLADTEFVVDDDEKNNFEVGAVYNFSKTNEKFIVDKVEKFSIFGHTADGGCLQIVKTNYCYVTKVDLNRREKHPKMLAVDDARLNELCKQARKIFADHGYDNTTRRGVMKWLNKWNEEKGWLVNQLRKSPNWDEQNLCIAENVDQKRTPSMSQKSDAWQEFCNYVFDDLDTERRVLKSYSITGAVIDGNLTQSAKDYISCCQTFKDAKINVGAKMTRVVRQLCELAGVTKNADFEKRYAQLTDNISDGVVKMKYCLSVNPLDFLLMSNGNSWSSCHYLDKDNGDKCYQAGTMSYPVDEVSMIFFSISDTRATDNFYSFKKCKRQIVCYDGDSVLQSRLYPDVSRYGSYDAKTNENIRNWELAKLDETAKHDWKTTIVDATKRTVHQYFATASGATHYPDYDYSDYHSTIISQISSADVNPFDAYAIGGETICPHCGDEHSRTGCCLCYDCEDDYDDIDDEE